MLHSVKKMCSQDGISISDVANSIIAIANTIIAGYAIRGANQAQATKSLLEIQTKTQQSTHVMEMEKFIREGIRRRLGPLAKSQAHDFSKETIAEIKSGMAPKEIIIEVAIELMRENGLNVHKILPRFMAVDPEN